MNADQITSQRSELKERILKVLISAYIILQVSVTLAVLSPRTFTFAKRISESSSVPFKFFGLWQGWELFSPTIRNVNSHAVALVHFDDGSMTQWPLPRTDQMNLIDKIRYDKLRKWNGDNIQWDRAAEAWPAFARYVGRLHYDGAGPKPVTMTLMRFQSLIPNPETGIRRADLPAHNEPHLAFFYAFEPGDFAK